MGGAPPPVSYPLFYVSPLRALPADQRLYPVDVGLPVTPDLPSGFLGEERRHAQGDDHQESTGHGDALEKKGWMRKQEPEIICSDT